MPEIKREIALPEEASIADVLRALIRESDAEEVRAVLEIVIADDSPTPEPAP